MSEFRRLPDDHLQQQKTDFVERTIPIPFPRMAVILAVLVVVVVATAFMREMIHPADIVLDRSAFNSDGGSEQAERITGGPVTNN